MSNPNEQCVLIVTFDPKPGQKEAFRSHLYRLVDAMKLEPNFVNTIVHEDLDQDDRLVLYEIWSGTRERWQSEEPHKAYRKSYEQGLPDLLADREVRWMTPVAEWGSSLTLHKKGE